MDSKMKRTMITGVALAFVVGGVLLTPSASAQRGRGGGSVSRSRSVSSGRGMRSSGSRGAARTPSRMSSRGRTAGPMRLGAPGRGGRSMGSGSSRGPGGLRGLGAGFGGGGGGPGRSLGPLMNGLRQAYGQRWGQDRYREDAYADAYRDVGLANAMVNLLGVIVTAGQQYPRQQPAGQHVTERVLVKEGHYETYEVQIPPVFDRHTGQQVGGGYTETRTRWVPEVWQERQVWVPGPAGRSAGMR